MACKWNAAMYFYHVFFICITVLSLTVLTCTGY